ncbi:MAG: hypothetical protein IPN79_08470 [Saprospiraceae bacterium]|nr:hypothetical protein [Saprospiraceae bacterium]
MKSFIGVLFILFLHFGQSLFGQSVKNSTGIEWIKPGQKYLKTKVAENGIYRISVNELSQAGLDTSNVKGDHIQVWNFGKQIPVFVSNSNTLSSNDYLEFYGEKLTIGIDSLLFVDWKNEMLNTEYSFVTDSNTYVVTFDSSSVNLRYETVIPDYENESPTPLDYYIHEDKQVFTDIFYKIQHGETQYSNFEAAEGWAKKGEKETNTLFELKDYQNNGIAARIGARLSSTIFFSRLLINVNNTLVDSFNLNPIRTRQIEYDILPQDIRNNMTLTIKNGYSEDLHRLAFGFIRYPRQLKASDSKLFFMQFGDVNGTHLLSVDNFNQGNLRPVVYNPQSRKRILANIVSPQTTNIILDVKPNQSYYLLNSESGFKNVVLAEVFEGKTFENKEADYLIITHKNLLDGARDYADFRSASQGGSYNVAIADVQDLYNHFGYGIDRHFYAIKNLAKHLKKEWDSLSHIFLLGKGLSYTLMRTSDNITSFDGVRFFVPTYGVPSSDNMLFSEENKSDPHFALGRLAALSNQEVRDYLEKIIDYEKVYSAPQTLEDKFWTKRVLHLSGGGNVNEQSLIKNNLLNMEEKIENSKLGSEVFTFYKRNSDVLASAILDGITNLVNTGVSIITFYGHSAPGTWDFNLEDPSKYKNTGKYPFINSLGCYSGNIFGDKAETISERFVKIRGKGAIGFVASGGTATINQLGVFGIEKYNQIANENYGKSIGRILQIMNFNQTSSFNFNDPLYQQLILHGDPAVKLYHYEGPDFIFDYTSLKTKPELINSSTDSISLSFDIYNLGYSIEDSLDVEFYHQLPSGIYNDTVRIRIPAPKSHGKYEVFFKNAGVRGIGKNQIFAKIDPLNKITELPEPNAEINNELVNNGIPGFTFYILDNTALPVEPCDFAIVTDPDISLKVSTSNALVKTGNFVFQIDTTKLFNSSQLTEGKRIDVRGLIEWKPQMLFTPGTVYYWRVSPDSISPEAGFLWKEASFVYEPQLQPGFNQSHFYQYVSNNKSNHIFMDEDRKFKFFTGEYLIEIVNGIRNDFTGIVGYKFNFDNPASSIRPWDFMPNGGVCIVLMNPLIASHVVNTGGAFGSIAGGSPSTRCFGFLTNTKTERKKVIDFLQNNIPANHFVYFFTVMNEKNIDLKVEEWEDDVNEYGTSIPQLLRDQGAVLIDSLLAKGSFPYTFKFDYNKGAINEGLLEDLNQTISTKSFVPVINVDGTIKIENIGPAKTWDRLEYSLQNQENFDSTYVNVYGVRQGKFIDTLIRKEKMFNISLANVDASIYPYLHVELYFKDVVKKTVPDVNHFRVFFNPVTDLVLDPKSNYTFLATKLTRGETLAVSVDLKNLTNENIDSIQVKYSIVNLEDNSEYNEIKKVGPIAGNKSVPLNFNKRMLNKPGKHLFVVEANYDQNPMEKHFFNNIGKQEFEVMPDKFNPFLDVYFDGQKILDGDIVSSNPEIKLILKDQNSFISLDDPELFSIKIDTGRNQIKEIPMNSTDLTFTAPTSPEESAVMTYHPSFSSGEYKLMVQAKDASGNFAGNNEKVISFRVIEEESVTNVLNYPNPFSTSTQFVFTLTGSEVPQDFTIRIFTITGKLIREISKEELGPLRIGLNRTQFKWDGTDEFGQKLANGVYLYKAFIQNSNGETFKNLSNQRIDSAFQEGFGKMVILR